MGFLTPQQLSALPLGSEDRWRPRPSRSPLCSSPPARGSWPPWGRPGPRVPRVNAGGWDCLCPSEGVSCGLCSPHRCPGRGVPSRAGPRLSPASPRGAPPRCLPPFSLCRESLGHTGLARCLPGARAGRAAPPGPTERRHPTLTRQFCSAVARPFRASIRRKKSIS